MERTCFTGCRKQKISKGYLPNDASGSERSLIEGTFCTEPNERGVGTSSFSSGISCLRNAKADCSASSH